MAKKSAGLPFYYILVKSASNDFIQVVDINQKTRQVFWIIAKFGNSNKLWLIESKAKINQTK